MYLTKITALVLRNILRIRKSVKEASVKSWRIAPAEESTIPPAIHFPEELDRITGFSAYSSREAEWNRVRGGVQHHHETVAHTFLNAKLYEGCLWTGAVKQRLVNRDNMVPSTEDLEDFPSATLASTLFGSVYFGHWMTDDLSLHLAAEAIATPLRIDRRLYNHEPEYNQLFGIEGPRPARARVKRLVVLTDFGQNCDKRNRYSELRRRLARNLAPGTNRLVYIRRGESQAGGIRRLVNRDQVEAHLASLGFAIVDPDKRTSREIAQALLGAEIVVGTEGSHLAHAVFTIADRGCYFILQPPYRFSNIFRGYADCLGQGYAFIVGTEVPGGFSVEPAQIDRMLERIATSTW